MISIDRKVCRDILRLTHQYNDRILFDPTLDGFCLWTGSFQNSAPSKFLVNAHEIPGSLDRLEQSSRIKMFRRLAGGVRIFSITPELIHAKAFWWDRVTKTYIGGFFSGVAVTVASGLILHFLV